MSTLRTFAVALAATVGIWAAIGLGLGWAALLSVVTLTVLEITFSFDNAVVNSKLLGTMSPWWQRFFMTVGILVAVFVVRFALPIFIVDLTAGLHFGEVVSLAIHHPDQYAAELSKAGPAIDAFGGAFLLMIAFGFFLDAEKDVHWIGWLERRLSPLGRYDNVGIFTIVALAVVVALTLTAPVGEKFVVLIAAICGVALHVGLGIIGAIFDDESTSTKILVGGAAAVMFVRLEILDASFSFDGVIGAFAITTSVVLIMAGLGAGALWVRSLTVHLVRTGALAKYRYLEHGAHWAILALGGVMVSKLYGIELPEAVTGSIGLGFIGIAVITSVIHNRRHADEPAGPELVGAH